MSVPARLTVVTLGARNLPVLRDFYAGLGWPVAIDLDGFAAFQMQGAVLALFPLEDLVADGRVEADLAGPGVFRGFSLAVNVDEVEQVDQTLAAAERAGGRVTKRPETAEWGGRSAYFADPEGNLWEIAWVPPESNMHRVLHLARTGTG
jgi:catechol 2,3-dioxygenase-like lactoylglutathione lyase family enzyme